MYIHILSIFVFIYRKGSQSSYLLKFLVFMGFSVPTVCVYSMSTCQLFLPTTTTGNLLSATKQAALKCLIY